ncbi:serine/threonine protein kinase [Actinophytocola xanthii]|uniref:non-specific serine/threonine protein kinase n=1 Tax=Actinophytocola xanthii TaxID=1912961 RepID=A0A1Q8CLV5_9PSEU|nr:serine/threonine protein kinase [Actinophytocola xanthii]
MVNLGSSLLSFAYGLFSPDLCPGDWAWATLAAGLVIGLLPVAGSLLVALVRKGTGNTYNAATLTVIAASGGFFVFLMPWLFVMGISEVFHSVALKNPTPMSGAEVATMNQASSTCWVGAESQHFGRGSTVYETLVHPSEGTPILLLRITMLVGVPALILVFVWLQARAAMRRGPKWPARLLWIPYALLFLLTMGVSANLLSFLWLGFLPASILGLLPVLFVGAPSWSVIERSHQKPTPPPAHQPVGPPPQPQRQQLSQQKPPPYEPPPPLPPYQPPAGHRTPPPTRVAPPLAEPEPDRAALAKLAADPGPLPFAPKGPAPTAPTGLWQNHGGRFQKIKPLGQGGFGTVWLAKDTQLDRTVAVKLAHAPDAETEARMLREARALAAVHHPHCVRVYDIIADPDGLGIIMEYIEGQQLADAVHEGGVLGDLQAARLWVTMAGALTAAHGKGVLHRDVKPANVIVDPNGNPHLIDFGIARAKGDSTLTATGMMVGTPDFLAPETASGHSATPASDAWQLAATVSFALTGQPPRGVRENAMASLMAAAKGEPLTQLPRRSSHLRLLTASMDTDPSRRPTLAAVTREMNAWLSRAGQVAEGPVTRVMDGTRPLR